MMQRNLEDSSTHSLNQSLTPSGLGKISGVLSAVFVLGVAAQGVAEERILPKYIESAQEALSSEEAQELKQVAIEARNLGQLYGQKGFAKFLLHRVELAQMASGIDAAEIAVEGAHVAVEGLVATGLLKVVRKVPVLGNFAKGRVITIAYATAAGGLIYRDTAQNVSKVFVLKNDEVEKIKAELVESIKAIDAEISAATGL